MSHFTKLDKAKIIDPDAFVKACEDLGFDQVTKGSKIKDFYGKQIDVDVACKAESNKYSIALQKNEAGQYDMVADWWGIRTKLPEKAKNQGIKTDSDLQDALLRHTTKHTIVRQYKRQGFRAQVTEDQDHNIKVRLQRA